MAELTSTELIAKINAIDTAIATVTEELATGVGPGGAGNLNYKMGNKEVDGTGRLKQLMESRKLYQDLLEKLPKVIIRNHDYDVKDMTGIDDTELVGDE